MNKIKVLYVHHGSGWGGAPISLINLIDALDKNNFDPHVLLLKDSEVKNKLEEKKISYTICKSKFYESFYNYLSHSDAGYIKSYNLFKILKMFTSWYLSKYIFAPSVLKKMEFDIVHLNSSVLSDWVYPSSKFAKVVYHVREPISKGFLGFRYKFIRSEVKKYSDKVIAISHDNSKRINLPETTEVVYNYVDVPEKVSDNNINKVILYVGGASEIKGINVLIDAIPYINDDILLKLAGPFPKFKSLGFLKKLALKTFFPKNFKLRSNLIKISKLKNIEIIGGFSSINSLLKKSSLLLIPNTVPHFSRPAVEAFAFGKPVIASDVIGMDEIIDNELNGILFNNSNPIALANAVNSTINSPKILAKMAMNGRIKFNENFCPKKNHAKLEDIYINMIKK